MQHSAALYKRWVATWWALVRRPLHARWVCTCILLVTNRHSRRAWTWSRKPRRSQTSTRLSLAAAEILSWMLVKGLRATDLVALTIGMTVWVLNWRVESNSGKGVLPLATIHVLLNNIYSYFLICYSTFNYFNQVLNLYYSSLERIGHRRLVGF